MKRPAALEVEHLDQANVAKFARLNVVASSEIVRCTTILGADLHDALVLPRRLDELATLPNVVAERFLDVNILTRIAGPDGLQRMPVIGGRQRDRINIIPIKQSPEIDFRLRLA